MINRRITLAFLLAATAALAAPALASAGTFHASSGAVSATVSYTGPSYQPKNLRLTITRAGRTVVNGQPVNYSGCGGFCLVSNLRVVDVEGDGEPDVIVDVFTGGAHCCSIAQLYRYNSTSGTYSKVSQYFGNSGYALNRIGGNDVFVTNDDRFYYAFAAYADSGAPIQIFALSGGVFYDVTRAYPAVVKRDAAFWWKTYKSAVSDKQRPETEGLFADWAADQELLGHAALVNRTLTQELRKHHLRSDFVAPKTYAKQLHLFLHKTGYIS